MKIKVGIIGGGQLGKMLAQEAQRMGIEIVILDPTRDCPASSLCSQQIVAGFKDAKAIRQLAKTCDVVTYEIELANTEILSTLQQEGFKIYPAAQTLQIIQDKLTQKTFLKEHGLPVPDFCSVEQPAKTISKLGLPLLFKNRTDAYDGRGNKTVESAKELKAQIKSAKADPQKFMLERFVYFEKEISVMVARNRKGQTVCFPVVENIHQDHILIMTLAPARISAAAAKKATQVALDAVKALNGIGIFGVEMFLTAAGEILINEIAPRPHNSGHYSIEACAHSQFELHLRAILDLPLVDPGFNSPAVMVNILGEHNKESAYVLEGVENLLTVPGVKLHMYGKKTMQHKRKLGHITALAPKLDQALLKAEQALNTIRLVPVK